LPEKGGAEKLCDANDSPYCGGGAVPRQLLEGLRRFQRDSFPRYRERYERLVAEGQQPTTLFIGCSDSRVVPDLLTGAEPGELFVIRNMGNFVPPYDPVAGFHGTAATIEYAVSVLGVSDVVVCGHTYCGAIRALYEPPPGASSHIRRWLELGADARLGDVVTEPVLRRTEERSVALQLTRLLEYPMIGERVEQGSLSLHGWHYIMESGTVAILDVDRGEFIGAWTD
jgi:carbonic anhydrase